MYAIRSYYVGYQPGTLKAVGLCNGKAVCQFELNTTGKPSRIVVQPENKTPAENGVVHAEIFLEDNKGNRVHNDDRTLQFELEGDGEILGLSNGNMVCLA